MGTSQKNVRTMRRVGIVAVAISLLGTFIAVSKLPLNVGGAAHGSAQASARLRQDSRAAFTPPGVSSVARASPVVRRGAASVRGLIEDEQSLQPVVGAVICLQLGAGPRQSTCETTDRSGRFGISAFDAADRLMVSAIGYASRRDIAVPGSGDVRVSLARAEEPIVSGMVVDGTGGRIVGAMVVARSGADEGEPLAATLTNEEGRFQLGAPAGELGLSASFESYATAEVRAQSPTAGVQLSLFPGTPLEGRVLTEASGEPVAGVPVAARSDVDVGAPAPLVTTKDDGSFFFEALGPGSYQIGVVSERWAGTPVPIEIDVAGAVGPARLTVNDAAILDVMADLDGTPCQTGHVAVSAAATSTQPLSAGRARFGGLLPGRYTVSIQCDGGTPIADELTLGRGITTRKWSLDTGLALRGTVRRASGGPIAGAAIQLERLSDSAESAFVPPFCYSDGDGRFRCTGLVAGTYQCRVAGRGSSDARVVSLAAGAPEPDLAFVAAARGTIRAHLNGPVPHGVHLVARLEGSHWVVPARFQGGVFVFEEVPLGRYVVSWNAEIAEPESFASATIDRDGQAVEVHLPASSSSRTISGRVVDGSGFPIEGAWVRAHVTAASWGAPGEPGSPVLSSAEGTFAIEGLLPGRYDVDIRTRTSSLVRRSVLADRSDLIVVVTDEASDGSED